MTRNARLGLGAAVVIGLAGWYLFRPERAFLSHGVSEGAPDGPSTVVLAGQFGPRAHDGHGRAEVLRLADGSRVLRFSDFRTLNGPDLQVYLLGKPDVDDRGSLARVGYLSLGPLKGNTGDQNYVIPADTDLGRYTAVAVWCRRFGVNFTTASLGPPAGGS